MELNASVTINAPPATIWPIVVEVTAWPEWTKSMIELTFESGGPPLCIGSTVRVTQPKLSSTTWTVTELEPEHHFTWTARTTGLKMKASHVLTARTVPAGGSPATRLDLSFVITGPLTPLVRVLTARLARRHLNMEAAGLKERAESAE